MMLTNRVMSSKRSSKYTTVYGFFCLLLHLKYKTKKKCKEKLHRKWNNPRGNEFEENFEPTGNPKRLVWKSISSLYLSLINHYSQKIIYLSFRKFSSKSVKGKRYPMNQQRFIICYRIVVYIGWVKKVQVSPFLAPFRRLPYLISSFRHKLNVVCCHDNMKPLFSY